MELRLLRLALDFLATLNERVRSLLRRACQERNGELGVYLKIADVLGLPEGSSLA